MSGIRAIIDTNVLYSGLYSSLGASFLVLRAIEHGQVRNVLSTTLVFEYEEVLKRNAGVLNLSMQEIDTLLDELCFFSDHHFVFFLWRPCLRDPKDDHILELAVASETSKIVTHNVKDFKKARAFGVRAITPGQLLEEIK